VSNVFVIELLHILMSLLAEGVDWLWSFQVNESKTDG